jgi:hypothetical protein
MNVCKVTAFTTFNLVNCMVSSSWSHGQVIQIVLGDIEICLNKSRVAKRDVCRNVRCIGEWEQRLVVQDQDNVYHWDLSTSDYCFNELAGMNVCKVTAFTPFNLVNFMVSSSWSHYFENFTVATISWLTVNWKYKKKIYILSLG